MKRRCSNPYCKRAPGLYPTCNACRQKGCKHFTTHYDYVYARVCDDCGTTVEAPKKKKGVSSRGHGQELIQPRWKDVN